MNDWKAHLYTLGFFAGILFLIVLTIATKGLFALVMALIMGVVAFYLVMYSIVKDFIEGNW